MTLQNAHTIMLIESIKALVLSGGALCRTIGNSVNGSAVNEPEIEAIVNWANANASATVTANSIASQQWRDKGNQQTIDCARLIEVVLSLRSAGMELAILAEGIDDDQRQALAVWAKASLTSWQVVIMMGDKA